MLYLELEYVITKKGIVLYLANEKLPFFQDFLLPSLAKQMKTLFQLLFFSAVMSKI